MDKGPKTNDNGPMAVAKHVVYRGRVQGVGFRYTAKEAAQEFAVSGYVRNLPSGEVEVTVEGEESVVDAFLDQIASRMAGCIKDVNTKPVPPTGYREFQIRY
jgi:acylphosphatase